MIPLEQGLVRKVGTMTIINDEIYIDEFDEGRYMIKTDDNPAQAIVYSPHKARLLYHFAEKYGGEFDAHDLELHLRAYFTIICHTVSKETAFKLAEKLTAIIVKEGEVFAD